MRLFRNSFAIAVFVMLIAVCASACAQPPRISESDVIIGMLNRTADDWNRGDLDAFAKGYKNSPDILFMGEHIRHGYDQMLTGYRKAFPNRDAMGKLTFTNLEVQPLDEHFATVTGRFHLERTAVGGGNAGGYFLLVVEKTTVGWKIIRDDTTDDPPSKH